MASQNSVHCNTFVMSGVLRNVSSYFIGIFESVIWGLSEIFSLLPMVYCVFAVQCTTPHP